MNNKIYSMKELESKLGQPREVIHEHISIYNLEISGKRLCGQCIFTADDLKTLIEHFSANGGVF